MDTAPRLVSSGGRQIAVEDAGPESGFPVLVPAALLPEVLASVCLFAPVGPGGFPGPVSGVRAAGILARLVDGPTG